MIRIGEEVSRLFIVCFCAGVNICFETRIYLPSSITTSH